MENKYANPITIYYCGKEKCAPGHSFGPAIRQHYLIHVILKGKGTYHTPGAAYKLGSGQAFLIVPGETTYYCADSDTPWEYVWIGLEGYEVPRILRKCGLLDGNYIYEGGDIPEYMDAAMQLSDFFSHRRNDYRLLSYLYLMFSYMIPETLSGADSFESSYLNAAKSYIHHNFSYDIKIQDIARHVGIDRTYLFKLFKKEEKTSPQMYLINCRLKEAMRMLEHTEYTITEIGFSCGFKDTPSFSRHFKNKIGQSPTVYRKNERRVL